MARGFSLPNDPFAEMLEEQARMEEERPVKETRKPTRQQPRNSGGYTRGDKRKPVILLIAFALLMSFAVGMTIIDRKYTEAHSVNSVQMQAVEVLFLDMNGDGQIDTAQFDINNDGIIDSIMQGNFSPVKQLELITPTPNPTPLP